MPRETMDYDIVIVGAGPAGLSAAIRLKQLNAALHVCVLEKGSQVGAHILSGAVLEPTALYELFPDWHARTPPLRTPVTKDEFLFLTETAAIPLPTPRPMHNKGNYIISLGEFCRWLAQQAEALGVEIYPGFAAASLLIDVEDRVYGVATGDMGISKDGQPTPKYQAGIEIHAKQTLLAEGCRGSLTRIVCKHYDLYKHAQPQTYAIGIKELWEVHSSHYRPGRVTHTVGWPLDNNTYGGSFIYHLNENLVAVGFVIGLDYQNPYLNPFEEMQRFKLHPAIKPLFERGKRISYGARALSEGGLQALPRLTFPGGMLIGDSAGFLNVPKIKGTHTAMKSGMVAAEAIIEALATRKHEQTEIDAYPDQLQKSWLWKELRRVRNIRPAFRWGLWPGLIYAAIDTYLLRGHAPWTLSTHADHLQLKPAEQCQPIDYPAPDNKISFDKLSSVYLSNTFHEENQPCHLRLTDPRVALEINYKKYAAPEQRYCPAGVYEIVYNSERQARLQINAQNCVHCKTCDIKDPTQNIVWVTPQGGEGPNYSSM